MFKKHLSHHHQSASTAIKLPEGPLLVDGNTFTIDTRTYTVTILNPDTPTNTKKQCIVLRGHSGAGKSHITDALVKKGVVQASHICSADKFFAPHTDLPFHKDHLTAAHTWCQLQCAKGLETGSVIIDNTNIEKWEMAYYAHACQKLGIQMVIIDVNAPLESITTQYDRKKLPTKDQQYKDNPTAGSTLESIRTSSPRKGAKACRTNLTFYITPEIMAEYGIPTRTTSLLLTTKADRQPELAPSYTLKSAKLVTGTTPDGKTVTFIRTQIPDLPDTKSPGKLRFGNEYVIPISIPRGEKPAIMFQFLGKPKEGQTIKAVRLPENSISGVPKLEFLTKR